MNLLGLTEKAYKELMDSIQEAYVNFTFDTMTKEEFIQGYVDLLQEMARSAYPDFTITPGVNKSIWPDEMVLRIIQLANYPVNSLDEIKEVHLDLSINEDKNVVSWGLKITLKPEVKTITLVLNV